MRRKICKKATSTRPWNRSGNVCNNMCIRASSDKTGLQKFQIHPQIRSGHASTPLRLHTLLMHCTSFLAHDNIQISCWQHTKPGVTASHLEGLLDIDGLLGRGFEVGNISLVLAPREGSLLRYHPLVLEVNLVPQHHKWEVVRIPAQMHFSTCALATQNSIPSSLMHLA